MELRDRGSFSVTLDFVFLRTLHAGALHRVQLLILKHSLERRGTRGLPWMTELRLRLCERNARQRRRFVLCRADSYHNQKGGLPAVASGPVREGVGTKSCVNSALERAPSGPNVDRFRGL